MTQQQRELLILCIDKCNLNSSKVSTPATEMFFELAKDLQAILDLDDASNP